MTNKVAPEYELYMAIIDQVTSESSDLFEDEEDQCDLQALKDLWKEKLIETKVVEPERLSTLSGQPFNHYFPDHARQQSNHTPAIPKQTPVSTISALMNIRLPKPQSTSSQSAAATQQPGSIVPPIINPKPVQLLSTVRAVNPSPVHNVVPPKPRAFIQPFHNQSHSGVNSQLPVPPKLQPYRAPLVRPVNVVNPSPIHRVVAPVPRAFIPPTPFSSQYHSTVNNHLPMPSIPRQIRPVPINALTQSRNQLNNLTIPTLQRPVLTFKQGTFSNAADNLPSSMVRPINSERIVIGTKPIVPPVVQRYAGINPAPLTLAPRQSEFRKLPIPKLVLSGKKINVPSPDLLRAMKRNISQFDGAADVGIMSSDDDDDDIDDDDSTFIANEKIVVGDGFDDDDLNFIDNEENVLGDVDDDEDGEVHDIDDETPPSMDEVDDIFDCDDVIICSYDSITNKKRRFRFNLASGIILCKGKECAFSHAKGEAELCSLKK